MKIKNLLLALALISSNAFAIVPQIQNENVKGEIDIETSYAMITGNLVISTHCIVSPSSLAGIFVGNYAYDLTTPANFNGGTTVVGIPGSCSAGQIQLSSNVNGNATGDSLGFGGPLSSLINDTKIWITANGLDQTLFQAIANGSLTSSPQVSVIPGSNVIDWNIQRGTGGTYVQTLSANTIFTFANVNPGQTIFVSITNTSGNYLVTWPGSVSWPNGTVPVQTIGNKKDAYTFVYDGTTIMGNVIQNFTP